MRVCFHCHKKITEPQHVRTFRAGEFQYAHESCFIEIYKQMKSMAKHMQQRRLFNALQDKVL